MNARQRSKRRRLRQVHHRIGRGYTLVWDGPVARVHAWSWWSKVNRPDTSNPWVWVPVKKNKKRCCTAPVVPYVVPVGGGRQQTKETDR